MEGETPERLEKLENGYLCRTVELTLRSYNESLALDTFNIMQLDQFDTSSTVLKLFQSLQTNS